MHSATQSIVASVLSAPLAILKFRGPVTTITIIITMVVRIIVMAATVALTMSEKALVICVKWDIL